MAKRRQYNPSIFRRGLALVLAPGLIGVITFFMLNLSWVTTKHVADKERVEAGVLGHLSQAFRYWGGFSEQYSRLLVSNYGYTRRDIADLASHMKAELAQSGRLGAGDNETANLIRKLETLFSEETQALENLAKSKRTFMDLIQRGTTANPESIVPILSETMRNFQSIKSEERALLRSKWNSLKEFRLKSNNLLSKFRAAIVIAVVLNLLLSILIPLLVSAQIARRLRGLLSSSKEFLKGNFSVTQLEGNDEFSYLQSVLRDTFQKIYQSVAHRENILAMVAHDMRAPLMSANANLNLLEENAEGFPEEALDVLLAVYSRLRLVSEVVGRVLGSERESKESSPVSAAPISPTENIPTQNSTVNSGTSNGNSFYATFEQVLTGPRLLHQILAFVIVPLFLQTAILSITGLQITRSLEVTNEAEHCNDMMMLSNLILLNSLLATTEQGYFWLSEDPRSNRLAVQDFDKAIDDNKELIALAGNDATAKDYSTLFLVELNEVRAKVMKPRTSSSNLLSSINAMHSIGQLHDSAPSGVKARGLEKQWLILTLAEFYRHLDKQEKVSAAISNSIVFGFVLYLIVEAILLFVFVWILNKRLGLLMETASLVGDTERRELPSSGLGTDEISDLHQTLKDAHNQLLGASAKRLAMLSCLSLEMRQPLLEAINDIETFSQMMKETMPEKCWRYLANSKRSIEQVLKVLDDLLTIESLGAGKIDLHQSGFDTLELINEATTTVLGLAQVKNISLVTDAQSNHVQGDKPRLVRVIVNLLANAIKFSKDGSRVRILGKIESGFFFVRVADDGVGISSEDLPHIFEQSYRASSTKENEEGYGLGLAICKMIVESHGGEIGATSNLGKGTTFWFKIPSS